MLKNQDERYTTSIVMPVSKFAWIMCKIVMNKLIPEHHVTMNILLLVTRMQLQTIGLLDLLETHIYSSINILMQCISWE